MKLSLAIVAHNEEAHIVETLESVYDIIDEAVLIDADCSDNTVDVVKKFDSKKKIRVYKEKNAANFIVNKQKAIERCKGDWILELDADEVVTPELKKEIIAVVKNNEAKKATKTDTAENSEGQSLPKAYWMPRLNHLMGKPLWKGGQYPDPTIRLYMGKHATFPVKTVHDQVSIDGESFSKANLIDNPKLGSFKNPLLHYPYRDIVTYFRKWSQYAIYDGDEWYKQGMRPSFWGFMKWCVLKPKWWFFLTYVRHKGFMDGFPGFIFSFFSALRYWVSYMRMYELSMKKS